MFLQNTDYQVIAQEIRKIRKPLMKISLDSNAKFFCVFTFETFQIFAILEKS